MFWSPYLTLVMPVIMECVMISIEREIRDILKSLKPILDVLMLLLFFMFIFALLGKLSASMIMYIAIPVHLFVSLS